MTILQAHKYYWPRDGASNYMLSLSKLLEERGETVIPFAMQGRENLPTPYGEFFVPEMNLRDPEKANVGEKIRYTLRMFYSIEAKKRMRKLLDTHPVDIAHIHNIYHHISPSILSELKRRKIPIVMTLHDYKLLAPNYTMFHHGAVHEEDARGWYLSCVKNKCMKDSRAQSAIVVAEMIWHHKIMKYYERYVDTFIAPSRFMRDICIKFGWDEQKFVHIPHPAFVESKHHVSKKDKEYVAYVGRLSEEKGLLVLLRAASYTPEIPYVIVGEGPLENRMRGMIASRKLKNVWCVGFKTGAELETIISEARVLVLPSIWYENYPLSILEAKAAGNIVIGSNIGGIGEMLPPELVVEAGNEEMLAHTIQEWYHKKASERKKMGAQLQEEVKKENAPLAHVRAIENVYAALTKHTT